MEQVSQLELPAADGFPLAATLFEPAAGSATASVLLTSATAVPRRYYRPFAAFLAAAGFRVLTFDYRGIGGSRPKSLRGFEASMHQWAEQDADGAARWLRDRFPEEPLVLVGHSFGGQGFGLMETSCAFQAALFVAVQSGYWRHWHSLGRPGMWLLWHLVIPAVTALFGYFPGWLMGLSEDLPLGVAREWAHWGRDPDYLLRDGHLAWERRYAAVHLPILALSFSDDGYAPGPAVEQILSFYPNAEVEHRHLEPAGAGARAIGHFGFFRERFRETLWQQSLDWLREQVPIRIPARPRG